MIKNLLAKKHDFTIDRLWMAGIGSLSKEIYEIMMTKNEKFDGLFRRYDIQITAPDKTLLIQCPERHKAKKEPAYFVSKETGEKETFSPNSVQDVANAIIKKAGLNYWTLRRPLMSFNSYGEVTTAVIKLGTKLERVQRLHALMKMYGSAAPSIMAIDVIKDSVYHSDAVFLIKHANDAGEVWVCTDAVDVVSSKSEQNYQLYVAWGGTQQPPHVSAFPYVSMVNKAISFIGKPIDRDGIVYFQSLTVKDLNRYFQ